MMRRIGLQMWLCAVLGAMGAAPAAASRAAPAPLGVPDVAWFARGARADAQRVLEALASGRPGAADSLARGLVARAEPRGGPSLADALDLHAHVLWCRMLPDDAELVRVATRALALRESARPADPVRLATALDRLGAAHVRRSEYATADSLFARAMAALDTTSQAQARAVAHALAWRAEGQRVVKRLAAAAATASRALDWLARVAPDDTTAAVRVHATLGNTCSEMSRLEEASASLSLAAALEGARARPDSVLIASTLRSLARARLLLADQHAEAAALLQRVAGAQERLLGPDHPELATTLYMLSYTRSQGGEFLEARRISERAVRIRERAYGGAHLSVAVALWQLGSSTRELGDAPGALAHYERAVEILRALDPPSPAELATGWSNLGAARLTVGDGRGAREAFDAASAIRERVFGPGAGRGFWSTLVRARALLLEGEDAAAEAVLDTLLAGRSRRSAYDEADALESQGAVASLRGDLAKAAACFERAYAFHDSALGAGSPRTLESLSLRAAAHWARGDRSAALADARTHDEGMLAFVRAAARGLSEREALELEASRAAGRDILLALAADPTGVGPAERMQVLDVVVRSRLAVLDELADEARALPRHDEALAPLAAELESARNALAAALVAATRSGRAGDAAIRAARTRREAAERALAERSGAFRAVRRRAAAGAAEVVAALPAGSALLSYVRSPSPRRILVAGTAHESEVPPARYVAFVLRAGAPAPVVVPLASADSLEPVVQGWLSALGSAPPADPKVAAAVTRRCDAIGRAVRARVWDPLAAHLAGATRVFVVPDGVLHRVPLAALPDGPGRYLVERAPLIHRLAAERDLVPWDAPARGHGLLALGGADFDRASAPPGEPLAYAAAAAPDIARERSTIPDSLRVRFRVLPETSGEVHEVASLWRGSEAASDAIALTGEAASEAAFKQLAPGRRVLHVATHGFALGASSRDGAPGTRALGGLGTGASLVPARAAVLLPGLALAGANAAPTAGGEDGFLTDEEITSLDLSSAEWAVLSACETGLVDTEAVEAVQGLHRAFRRAGVRTVIASLWPVDDAATRTWMRALYESRTRRGTDTATAVRDAARAAIAARRAAHLAAHPFHWAAFVASGEWR